MAYTTNNCTGTDDFLNKIKADLIANNWALLADRMATTRELYFQNVNTDVIIDFKVIKSPTTNKSDQGWYENIVMNSPTAFSSGLSFYNQPGGIPVPSTGNTVNNLPTIPSYDKAIKYALFINDNRIVIAYKISTFTASCYVGKIKTYSSPAANTHPVFVGGSCQSDQAIEDFDRNYTEAGSFAAGHGRFSRGANYYYNGTDWVVIRANLTLDNYPSDNFQFPVLRDPEWNASGTASRQLDNTDGTVKIDPIKIILSAGWAGELDGVYLVVTKLVNCFDTATKSSDGKECIIFNNITRNSNVSFFGVEK